MARLAGERRMTASALSIAEILDQPALVPLWPTVGKALGLAESTTYQLAAQGRLPIEVIPLGRRRVARSVDLQRFLGLLPQENGTAPTYQAGASAGNDEEAGYQPASPVEQSAATAK
ncbi:DNA-binding protein [Streptomyces sp. NPDC058469]|uniref:DNA-binding protein n=1 Tax=Streptomyces sp. NPDC058469 TaxID=3346514 RepID=UPI0036691275